MNLSAFPVRVESNKPSHSLGSQAKPNAGSNVGGVLLQARLGAGSRKEDRDECDGQ